MEKKNKKYFPIFVDLMDRKIVVVGAGTIAKRRIRALVDFTEHLYVIAPEVNPELRDLDAAGRLTIIRRKYEKGDICGASFVIAATNDNRLNQEIYADCKEAGIPVNVCNDKTRCDFYFPVLAYDDTIVAGVSSAGHDAAGSKRVANQIREMLRETEKTAEPVQQAAGTVEAVTERSCDTIGQDADAPGSVEKVITQKAAGKVRIFTDGAARGNPDGPGGYGVILQYTDAAGELHERQFSQGYVKTTNNRMELMAAIVGLEALKRPCEIELYSDSQYLIKAFNEHWLDGWIKKNWMRNKTDPVKNVDLWKRLLAAAGPHRITWNWVKGHDGHPENERCDQLATGAADGEDLIEDVVQVL